MAAGAVPNASSPMWRGLQDLILPVALVGSVLVILVPMPAAVMDVLLSANITLAVIVLLTTIYVRTPLEFSIFPSLLLATTLGRLVLNVATTRLILTRAESHGMLAAGHVVKTFGEFVTGDKIVVGFILFIIIVVIQFVVITKGATRISEVAARFALDGMPGRQMAIDADLNAGAIDEREAQRRRADITQQADFFAAMDGASKFVRGDAVAGIIITLVNIMGGLTIGVAEYHMNIGQAAALFTKLTIGDGLVTQVPAFLISVAAALLVTRSSSQVNLPGQFLNQLFSRPEALAVAAGFVGLLVFTSLPAIPLLTIGGGCAGLAFVMSRRQREAQSAAVAAMAQSAVARPVERIEDYLSVDPMEIELGIGLIRLAEPQRGGDLLQRIQRIRQSIATDIGLIMPKVRVRDNMRLDQNQYRIKIADLVVAEGRVYANMLLAVDSGASTGTIKGTPAVEPATGASARWIETGLRDQAQRYGYRIVEPVQAIAAHLAAVVRRHADEILSRDATKHLVEELRKTSPAAVEGLIPGQMTLAEVQQILQMLLREEVPIRQLGPILETLADCAARSKDPLFLTECVRQRLARTICARYRDGDQKLYVVTLDPALEDRIRAGTEHTDRGLAIRTSPDAVDTICRSINDQIEKLVRAGHPPLVLVSPQTRAGLKQMTLARLPRLVVLSYDEITRDTHLESIGLATEATAGCT